MEQAQNVISNAIAPVDFRKSNQLLGTAEYVAVEVLVSKIIRGVLKMENRGVWELAWVHLLSIPFLGGAGAPFGATRSTTQTTAYSRAAMDGARGIPAVLLAQYVYSTAYAGFHIPKFNFKDLLITAGSKSISRPLVYSIIDKLPQSMQDGFTVLDELARRQTTESNIAFT